MNFKRKPMVRWYDIRQLAATGVKTIVSSTFGNFADKRELQSVLSSVGKPENYSSQPELWIDYISDMGDGFNSTYTMAHLLAKEKLEVEGEKLSRADIVILGGDEVYPTPEKVEYKNRLQGPYNAAFPKKRSKRLSAPHVLILKDGKYPYPTVVDKDGSKEHKQGPYKAAFPKELLKDDTGVPHLFAVPGNHDWYDGLSNFLKLFCQGRSLGNWLTRQKRSYFAIQLRSDCWLWGLDIQLHGNIDQPQIDYFSEITKQMAPDDKVIICTAEPAWVLKSIRANDLTFDRLSFFIRKEITEKGFKHILTLTGDLHHYAHYEDHDDQQPEVRHLVTAGGGGAFTHPTHILKEEISTRNKRKKEGKLTACYPSKGQSRMMAFLNLLFPFYNPIVSLLLGGLYLFSVWILQSSTDFGKGDSLMEKLADISPSVAHLNEAFFTIWEDLALNPAVLLLNALFLIGFLAFADKVHGNQWINRIAGALHGILHILVLYVLMWIFSYLNLSMMGLGIHQFWQVVAFFFEMQLLGGLVAGFLFGFYLLISILLLKCHPTEAFSSFRYTGYKNFIRLHLKGNVLTVYPIGVDRVVTNWRNVSSDEDNPRFKGDEPKVKFIEKPFEIKI
jgi:nitrate reductase NapE component